MLNDMVCIYSEACHFSSGSLKMSAGLKCCSINDSLNKQLTEEFLGFGD